MSTILVFGATGTVGTSLLRELRERGAHVRAFVHDRAPAGVERGGVERAGVDGVERAGVERAGVDGVERGGVERAGVDGVERGGVERAGVDGVERGGVERAGVDGVESGGVERVRGDLDDPASVRAALDGADQVLLCTPNHPRQVEREIGVIDAAVTAGVDRLVKISAIVAHPGSASAFADAHGRIEEHLSAAELPAVVLRPGFHTSNLLAGAATIRALGRFFLPAGEAKVAMTDPRDIAAVAAVVLTEDGHDGRTYPVTGPYALTCAEAAAELSAALGRPVEFVDVPDDAARAGMLEAGVPEWLADQIVLLWAELRHGAGATTSDVVRVLTGRDPRTVADFARDHAAAFAGP